MPVVARLFRTGRLYMGEDSNDPAFCDLAQLLAVNLDGLPFEEVRPLVDKAVAEGRWLILAGHEIGEGGFQTTRAATLAALCRLREGPLERPLGGHGRSRVRPPPSRAGEGPPLRRPSHRSPSRSRHAPSPACLRRPRLAAATPLVFSASPAYLDPAAPLDARVEDLLRRMTLEEKVGQMNMPCVYEDATRRDDADEDRRRAGTSPPARTSAGPRARAAASSPSPTPSCTRARGSRPSSSTSCSGSPSRRRGWASRCSRPRRARTASCAPGATIFPEGPGPRQHLEPRRCSANLRGRRARGARRSASTSSSRWSSSRTATRASAATRRRTARTPTSAPGSPKTIVARRAGRRRLRARQGRGRALPLPGPEPAVSAASSAAPWRFPSASCARCSCPPGWPASATRARSA